MRRLQSIAAVLALAALPAGSATPVYVTPDVPTDESLSGTTILHDEVRKYTGAGYPAESLGPLPPNTMVDAVHKLDAPGDWLFSVEAPIDFPGFTAVPEDVVRYDSGAGSYSLFFCGASLTADAVPPGSNLDALYLDGPDTADLIVSFDVPTTIPAGGATFDPGDLVRYERFPAGGAGCMDWALAAANPELDFSAVNGVAFDTQYDVTGADRVGGEYVLAFDVPTDVSPPASTFLPGELVSFSAGAFGLWEALGGWPADRSSEVDGLSCLANPGRVPETLVMDKSTITPGDLVLTWSASCADGAEEYGIYEGTLGTWYSHSFLDCIDDGSDLTEEITPAAGDTYYLVIPYNNKDGEGSYGLDFDFQTSASVERPVGSSTCASPQIITPCP